MKITSGSQDITRNILEDFEKLHGDKIKFQGRSDGVNLETVRIRTQEWTVENLNVSKYRNGDIIPEVKNPKGGGTNIYNGMVLGYEQITKKQIVKGTNRLVLLTDGYGSDDPLLTIKKSKLNYCFLYSTLTVVYTKKLK